MCGPLYAIWLIRPLAQALLMEPLETCHFASPRKEKVMSNPNKKSPKKKSVSRILRETIREKGLTAYSTAKQAGVSVDAVQRFLNAERGLTLGTVDKIAESLDLTLCTDDSSKPDK